MANPKCVRCGKSLKQNHNFRLFNQHDAVLSVDDAAKRLAVDPALIYKVDWEEECEVSESGALLWNRKTGRKVIRSLHVRNGTYGYGGHGLFCTQSCGYYWAVGRIRGRGIG